MSTVQPSFTFRAPDRVFWWTLAAGAAAGVAVATYTIAKRTYDALPVQYHYRPGTISGWLAGALSAYSRRRRKQMPVRVYMDGCFDMMHYGHANALRQAKALGDELVVGLIPDKEILRCKGPPVMNDEERYTLVEAVKWVDEIIRDVPYDLSPEFIQDLFTKHRIDYIVHGDDPCLLPDGTDAYAHAKKLGRYIMVKRTEGISTTDIVGRMLTCTRANRFVGDLEQPHPLQKSFSSGLGPQAENEEANTSQSTTLSKFLPTSRRIVQFSNGKVAPENAKTVYIDGAFDVFHPGHVKILKAAKEQGDFLLVGIHSDEDVECRRGPYLPIMSLHERSLSVLACKYVDEVVIGAPVNVTEDLIKTFNISLVVRGSTSETSTSCSSEDPRYEIPRNMGIYRQLQSPSIATAKNIIQRIVDKKKEFEARNAKKSKSEAAYYSTAKTYVAEL